MPRPPPISTLFPYTTLFRSVIGHVPLTDKVNGFAKAGWGNDIKQSYQVGAQYEVKPNIDLNVYYGYDKYSVNDNDKTSKGLHAGVGYTF